MNRFDTHPLPPELEDALGAPDDPERRRLERVWTLLGRLSDDIPDASDDETAWHSLTPLLDAPAERNRIDRPTRPPTAPARYRWKHGVFAALALLLVAVALLWQMPVTVDVGPGEQQSIVLPDGSTVELNSGSRMRYPRGFSFLPGLAAETRLVELEGEAFFDVVRDGRPFLVETALARVEVLGTRFNVRTRPDGGVWTTVATLASGRIRVSPIRSADGLVLDTPGESARVAATQATAAAPTANPNLDVVLAWRDRGFAVTDQPLADILDEFRRRYAVTVSVGNGVDLADSLTLLYQRGTSPETILEGLCVEQGCRFRETNTGYDLFMPPPSTPE